MLAVRPPEFFPRLPVAALLLAADRVVLADTFAFSRQGAHNRARICTATGAQWLTVPRQHAPVGMPLRAVGVVDDGWARRHGHALRTAYGMAPYYDHYAPDVANLLAGPHASLAALTVATTRWTARALGATADLVAASGLDGAPDTLPGVVHAVGADALLVLTESAERDRAQAGVPVWALHLNPTATYRQTFPGFVGGLSSLDLLMNHGPASADWLREATRAAPVG